MLRILSIAWLLSLCLPASAQQQLVNDISGLNPIAVSGILRPTTTAEIVEAVRTHAGPISIGGGRYSMGGQTATNGALQIDMRSFNRVIAFDPQRKEITVQSGITWRKLQEVIDPYGLSVKIMQTYANFTVGGSLSVNCHGRYVGQGPIVSSVKRLQIVLANGDVLSASPPEHADIFYGAIGGYGALGVITEVTLELVDNTVVERRDTLLPISAYAGYFLQRIRSDSTAVFHNGDIYPRRYRRVHAVTYSRSSAPLTDTAHLRPLDAEYRWRRKLTGFVAGWPGGKTLRQHLFDPIVYRGREVVWRNHEASYDVLELEPASRKRHTYVLQEYFVPVDSFGRFYPLMAAILRRHRVNVLNVSIRHARPDPGTALAWARSEVFAFVLYYRQGTGERAKAKVGTWTRELIDAALRCGGSYYLPYQLHATPEQFARAYPRAREFFLLKRQLDPGSKFRNRLWDAYNK